MVTGDALYTQRELCKQIVDSGGEYLFVVKENQPTLLEDIAALFADPPAKPAEATQYVPSDTYTPRFCATIRQLFINYSLLLARAH